MPRVVLEPATSGIIFLLRPIIKLRNKMSFVDLATLTMHRRHEMEARINSFLEKCDHAIRDLKKLKLQAKSFVHNLNCEPSELKDRFLSCMKQLDEFTYLVTDFNLAMSKLDSTNNIDFTPVQDISSLPLKTQSQTCAFNLMDALSEPIPSTSKECTNYCKEKPVKTKVPKEDQLLIAFSSTSCSSESVPLPKSENELHCNNLIEEVKKLNIDYNYEECKLPAQTILQIDHVYTATIMHTDGISFWVITDNVNEVVDLMTTITEYYKQHKVEMSIEELKMLTYCAVYDETEDCYYRGFLVNLKRDMSVAEVFLVDTGETRQVSPADMQPLDPMFCKKPPYARCCHLAGLDILDPENTDLMEKQEMILKELIGGPCRIRIDDNSSESLDVYLMYWSGEVVNDKLLSQRETLLTTTESTEDAKGLPELAEENFNIAEGPEYDDPVEAVTGYSNRDEIDICKHYKGGSKKTCFKGSRCTKKHIRKHPVKCKSVPLPAPGAWRRVLVTFVAHFDRFYVHLLDGQPDVKETIPRFGVVLPPTTLDALILDMNSEATRAAYKPLKMMPCPGELVAALYSDEKWYRAKVLSSTRADQNVEVLYIDYGQVFWVKEDAIAELEPRFCSLAAQAVRCVLAGVEARSQDFQQWALAKAALTQLIHERTLQMHVICQDYDEVVVELFDESDYSISEQLAASEYVNLKPYSVEEDKGGKQKIVVP
ncbi:unnamed protein product, partial [Brenthis ino]